MTPTDWRLLHFRKALDHSVLSEAKGRIREVTGTLLRATLPATFIGEVCLVRGRNETVLAEVVGFREGDSLLLPLGEVKSLGPNSEVTPTGSYFTVPVGDGLRGRVLDGLGEPIDGLGPLAVESRREIYHESPHPIHRSRIRHPFPVGIRAIDGLLTCGEGQRMGIFAAAGAGKSTLLGQIARNTQAFARASGDPESFVTVVVLVGERGREVNEFLEDSLGKGKEGPENSLKNCVVVVATSEKPALVRMKAAYVGTRIAEYFRDERQKKVLLMMDSVTRFARALREVGLNRGEPPTRYGFPPSVFAELPRLFERVGNADEGPGSVTGFYTVLVEGDNLDEPVADESRSLLDGHIILSRKLAGLGIRPSIEVLDSESRVKDNLDVPECVRDAARRFNRSLAVYRDNEEAIKFGFFNEHIKSDEVREATEAKKRRPDLLKFLHQRRDEVMSWPDTQSRLVGLFPEPSGGK